MSPSPEFTQTLQEWTEIFMHHSMREFKRFMSASGLSASQLNVMMRLYHEDRCEITEVATQLDITPAASSQLVERLVQQRLVERLEASHDRRVKQLRLTQRGRDLIQQGIEARRRWMEALTIELTPQEQEDIQRALKLLTQAARCLEQAEPSPENRPTKP